MTIKKNYLVRLISIIISLVLCFLSFLSCEMDGSAFNNTKCKYHVYNATTGEYLRDYTLSPLNNSDNTPTTINDDFDVDWSKSGVVKIFNGNGDYRGSGFVIDAHVILTAAHVVSVATSYESLKLSKICLFDIDGNKDLEITPIEYHVPVNFMAGYSGYDYALITVNEDLSAYDCFDLGTTLDSIANNNQNIKVTGFPQTDEYGNIVNTNLLHNKYTATGTITGFDTTYKVMKYELTTVTGMSGGAVYIENEYKGVKYNTIIAIHFQGVGNISNNGSGTRITTNQLHFYNNNPNLIW